MAAEREQAAVMALEDRLEGELVARGGVSGQTLVLSPSVNSPRQMRPTWRLNSHLNTGVQNAAPQTAALESNLRPPRPSVRGHQSRRTDMRARMGLLAVTLCALLIAVPVASAQEPAGLTQVVPVTGKSKSGKQFSGRYAIDR